MNQLNDNLLYERRPGNWFVSSNLIQYPWNKSTSGPHTSTNQFSLLLYHTSVRIYLFEEKLLHTYAKDKGNCHAYFCRYETFITTTYVSGGGNKKEESWEKMKKKDRQSRLGTWKAATIFMWIWGSNLEKSPLLLWENKNTIHVLNNEMVKIAPPQQSEVCPSIFGAREYTSSGGVAHWIMGHDLTGLYHHHVVQSLAKEEKRAQCKRQQRWWSWLNWITFSLQITAKILNVTWQRMFTKFRFSESVDYIFILLIM